MFSLRRSSAIAGVVAALSLATAGSAIASPAVEALSGGTRQKLNLALALLHDPQLLLLDEPYAGFDWEPYVRFWDMAERRRAAGMGILIVSTCSPSASV